MVKISEPSRTSEFRARLEAAQHAARTLRTAAFVRYAPTVCGLTLRPITLATYTTLLAWRHAAVTGDLIDVKAIAKFVWLHHPDFSQHADPARRRVFRQIDRALTPRLPNLSALARLATPLLARRGWLARHLSLVARHFIRPTAGELRTEAATEIRRLVHEALHDFPPGDDDGEPTPYALKPQLVSLFIRGYAMPFREAEALVDAIPLKELFEYLREILHRLSRGRDKMLTPAEAAVWRDYLDYQNPAPVPSRPSPVS